MSGKLKRIFSNEMARLLAITVVIFVLMTILRPSSFFSVSNITSMAFQMPEIGLLALAVTLSFITGGMDLSLVGIANLSAICAGLALSSMTQNAGSGLLVSLMIVLSIVISLAIGAVCGLLNGFLVSKLKVIPMLATLGTMQLFTGIAMIITKGSSVVGLPVQFSVFGQSSIAFIPVPMLIMIICAISVFYLLDKTKLGIELRLIGTNEKAAVFSGIAVNKAKMLSYMYGGVIAAVAGIIMMSRVNSAKADFGSSYTMQSILVAVLGGVSPSGGKGKVAGVVLAVCVLQFLSSGFNMLRVSQYAKELVWGLLLILLVSIMVLSERREST